MKNKKKIKEENINKQRIRSKKYYWNNREAILEKHRVKRVHRSEYFKEWYQKNKLNKLNNNNNNLNNLNNNNKIKEKPNFTITFN